MRARRLKLHPMTANKLLRLKREAEGDGVYRVAKRILCHESSGKEDDMIRNLS
jgi:hypothetical protein